MKTLLALIIFCAVSVQGQILVYKMAYQTTTIGNGITRRTSERAYLVVDLKTGAAAKFNFYSWWPNAYTVHTNTLTIDTVNGAAGKDYTVFSEILVGTNSGRYHFISTARGIKVMLDIGLAESETCRGRCNLLGATYSGLG